MVNCCPNQTYDFELFVVDGVEGELHNSEGDSAKWIPIEQLRKEPKRFGIVRIYDKDLLALVEAGKVNVVIECDSENNVVSRKVM